MAYSFTRASSQWLSTGSTPVTAAPLTICGWMNASLNTSCIASIGKPATANNAAFYVDIDTAGNPGRAAAAMIGTFGISVGNNTTLSSWNHYAGVFTSTVSRTAYVNGVAGTTNTTYAEPASVNDINIGRAGISSGLIADYLNGLGGEVAIWNAALTAAEVASLAKGFKPFRVRPQSLVFYAPIIRELRDWRGALTITNNNTATVANHPRMY